MPPHTLDTPYRCNFLWHRSRLIARHTIPHRLHNQERHSLHSMWNNLPPGSADKQNNRNHTQHIINVIPRIIRQQNRNKTRQKPPHLHFPKRPVQFHLHPQVNKPQNSHPITQATKAENADEICVYVSKSVSLWTKYVSKNVFHTPKYVSKNVKYQWKEQYYSNLAF